MEVNIVLTEENLQSLHLARELLHKDQHLTIDELSVQVRLNRKKLKYGFKQLFGTTINRYEIQLKMDKAIELMLNSKKTVSQIALKAGYRDVGAFSSAFKKVYGMPPRNWRKANVPVNTFSV